MQLSSKARLLILSSEGVDQPTLWPGEDSGVTIGIGCDLGYLTPEAFRARWAAHLSGLDFARLLRVVGLKGPAARVAAPTLHGIRIGRAQAVAVFDAFDVPESIAITAKTFRGSESLPADAFGALVSLVYNRGEAMTGDRRREMRVIRNESASFAKLTDPVARALALRGTLREIGHQLRSMVRLWGPGNSPGLVPRRLAEADLVESCIPRG